MSIYKIINVFSSLSQKRKTDNFIKRLNCKIPMQNCVNDVTYSTFLAQSGGLLRVMKVQLVKIVHMITKLNIVSSSQGIYTRKTQKHTNIACILTQLHLMSSTASDRTPRVTVLILSMLMRINNLCICQTFVRFVASDI